MVLSIIDTCLEIIKFVLNYLNYYNLQTYFFLNHLSLIITIITIHLKVVYEHMNTCRVLTKEREREKSCMESHS